MTEHDEREPTLEDMLSDPLVKAVMTRDRVDGGCPHSPNEATHAPGAETAG